jgi:hypothetical protein
MPDRLADSNRAISFEEISAQVDAEEEAKRLARLEKIRTRPGRMLKSAAIIGAAAFFGYKLGRKL